MVISDEPPEPEPAVSRAEQTVWEGCSSQVVNFRAFFYSVLALIVIGLLFFIFYRYAGLKPNVRQYIYIALGVLALIPIFVMLYNWIENRNRRYRVTTERIHVTTGVFSKSQDDLELYRVRDYQILRPFWMRLFGLGTIQLVTSDRTTPVLKIQAIRNSDSLLNSIREHVEHLRKTKRVREVDMTE